MQAQITKLDRNLNKRNCRSKDCICTFWKALWDPIRQFTTFEYWPSIATCSSSLLPLFHFQVSALLQSAPVNLSSHVHCARRAIESQSCKAFGFGHSIVCHSVVQFTAGMAWERFGCKNCKIAVSIQLPLTFCFELCFASSSLSFSRQGWLKYCENSFDHCLKILIVWKERL